jgi:glyoxylase-like metal-dependent hydrolase (beta-lactamase superfamily II)
MRPYSFRVGAFRCTALSDGASTIGAEGVMRRFPQIAEADLRLAFDSAGQPLSDADSSLNILAVETGGDMLLVDAGEAGRPRGGQLLNSLREAFIAPDSVTIVVITHIHGDHVQGLLDAAGKAAFPNARYVMSSVELAWWAERAPDSPERALITERGVSPVEMDAPILPGVSALPLPGHTPGQIGLRIESQGQWLLHLADALHNRAQFLHPEWSPTFDHDPTLAALTRREALQKAAQHPALTFLYHLSFPGLGTVSADGAGFAWHPVPVALD